MYISHSCKSLLKNCNTIISTFAWKSAHFALLLKTITIAIWNSRAEKYLQVVTTKLLLQVIT